MTQTSSKADVFWMTKVLFPLLLALILVAVATQSVLVSSLATLSVLVFASPLIAAGYHGRKIRNLHPGLRMLEPCFICGNMIRREKSTANPLLLPYAFKILRHYENTHQDIRGYARRVRLSLTGFLHTIILTFAIIAGLEGLRSLGKADSSLLEATLSFSVPFFLFIVISWGVLSFLLLRRKGLFLDPKNGYKEKN